jgi:hypothetical protein
MTNRFWSAFLVLIIAVGFLFWGFFLHPDEVSARGHLVTPYLVKGFGVIGLIGSIMLFLGAVRHNETHPPQK